MAKNTDVGKIMKRLDEIDRKFSQLNLTLFAYVHAILGLLNEKGVTDSKEFKQYLDKYKKDLEKRLQDAEFLKMMERQFKGKGKK